MANVGARLRGEQEPKLVCCKYAQFFLKLKECRVIGAVEGAPLVLKSHFRTARPSLITLLSDLPSCGSLKTPQKLKKSTTTSPPGLARTHAHARVVVDFLVLYIILSNSVDNYITRGRARKLAEAQSVKIPNWSKIPQFAQNCDKLTNILPESSTRPSKATFNTLKHFALKYC